MHLYFFDTIILAKIKGWQCHEIKHSAILFIVYFLFLIQINNSDVAVPNQRRVFDCQNLVVHWFLNQIKFILIEIIGNKIVLGHVI